MRNALSELASINSQTSAHLREILESHGVSFNYSDTSRARGTAYFTAFDPDGTCLRFPPLTVRFFQDAVKFNVFTSADAQEISFQVARCCQKHGREYKGAFSGNLSSGIFGDFLTGAMTRNGFLYKESVYGWCVDAFAAHMLWPVIPDFHLRVSGYRPVAITKQGILGRGRGPFLRFVNAVDIAALGACGGLSVNSLMLALSWLNEPSIAAEFSGHRPSGGGRVGAAHHALFFLRISRSGFWLLHGPPCPPKGVGFQGAGSVRPKLVRRLRLAAKERLPAGP